MGAGFSSCFAVASNAVSIIQGFASCSARKRSYSRSAFAFATLRRDGAGVIEQLAPRRLEELVELVDPVAHRHRLALQRLQLGELDVEVHDAVEHLQLGLGKVVLRDGGVGLADYAARTRRLHAPPMNGLSLSARSWTISAAVWPCAAQCICTVTKNCCERSVSGW